MAHICDLGQFGTFRYVPSYLVADSRGCHHTGYGRADLQASGFGGIAASLLGQPGALLFRGTKISVVEDRRLRPHRCSHQV